MKFKCPSCNAVLQSEDVSDGAQVQCPQCGNSFEAHPHIEMQSPRISVASAAYAGQVGQKEVPNYLVWTILSLFCCAPFAIVALLSATKVDGLVKSGNMNEAREHSENAKKWMTRAFICGAVMWVLQFIIGVIVALCSD